MIRLRASVFSVVGVGLLLLAVSFPGAVCVHAITPYGQQQTARLHASPPVGVRLAQPIEDLRGEPADGRAHKQTLLRALSATQPHSSVHSQTPQPKMKGAQGGQSFSSSSSSSWIEGDKPPADTSTLVEVRTCGGGTFVLNVAEKQMLELHNQSRRAYGVDPLCLSAVLTQSARARSEEMLRREYFSHYSPAGKTVIDKLRREGYYGNDFGEYHWVGENIALGGDFADQDSPQQRFRSWMESAGHRENILREEFDEVGVGALSGTYQDYDDTSTIYTTVFGGR
jgi:uncharacterized protein YkwD